MAIYGMRVISLCSDMILFIGLKYLRIFGRIESRADTLEKTKKQKQTNVNASRKRINYIFKKIFL